MKPKFGFLPKSYTFMVHGTYFQKDTVNRSNVARSILHTYTYTVLVVKLVPARVNFEQVFSFLSRRMMIYVSPDCFASFLTEGRKQKNISKCQREASFSFSLGDFCSFGAIVCLCKTKEQQKDVTRVRESKVFFLRTAQLRSLDLLWPANKI